ncbi:MAG: BamA/TamA family outer membrane protein [Bacteroidales bacterium]
MRKFLPKNLIGSMLTWLLIVFVATGQENNAKMEDSDYEAITIPAPQQSDLRIQEIAEEKLQELYSKGFLEAQLKNIIRDTASYTITLNKGQRFYYIPETNLDPLIIKSLNVESYFVGRPVNFEDFNSLTSKILNYLGNTGYPFARLHKNNIEITDSIIKVELLLDRMEYIVFDTLSITGDLQLKPVFLENHLGITPAQAFSEDLVNEATDKISDLTFTELSSPMQLSFSPGKARLILPMNKVRTNRFDGIIGLSSTTEQESSLSITGLLNLFLENTFGMGDKLSLSWRALGQGTQILDLAAHYPYPLKLPITTGIDFSLHRQDTTWLQLRAQPVVGINTASGFNWRVFMHYNSTSLISTKQYENVTDLPPNLDFKSRVYGIRLEKRTSGFNRSLIQSGYNLNLSIAAGSREILKNAALPEFIYENRELKSLQLNFEAFSELRFSISDRSTFTLTNRGAWINGQQIPVNQLYRLGGFQSLKGFDEYSMLASAYITANAEYRFFTGQFSFFSLFINGGWYEQKTLEQYMNDLPLGIGAGLNLETQAGILALYFAIGRQNQIPFELRNAKIHVGYVSTF